MPDQNFTTPSSAADTDNLSRFVIELGIARRNINSYPDTHPLIKSSIEKTLHMLARVLDIQPEVAFGVMKNSLMVGDDYLDRKNPVFRDFAASLFQRGIAVLTLRRGLGAGELLRFCHLLGENPEDIREAGGVGKRAEALELAHIGIRAIDYTVLGTVEQNPDVNEAGVFPAASQSLWERLVHGLLGDRLDVDGVQVADIKFLEPEMVADILNKAAGAPGTGEQSPNLDIEAMKQTLSAFQKDETGSETGNYAEALAAYMQGGVQSAGASDADFTSVDRLARLIFQLSPEVRKKFLPGLASSIEHQEKSTERLLSKLPPGIIMEILDEINARAIHAPPKLLSILARLTGKPGERPETGQGTDAPPEDEATARIRILFREEKTEDYVPESYQETLNRILEAPEQGTLQEEEEVTRLRAFLLAQSPDAQAALVTLELMRNKDLLEDRAQIQNQLLEFADYLLETGDFKSLLRIYQQLAASGEAGESPSEGLAFFSRPEFTGTVLEGLVHWGKEIYPDIGRLIQAIGDPFIKPMLARLASESNMSVRRFLIDAISEAGSSAIPYILPLLRDSRWFFVRNLLIILRNIRDPAVLPHVKPVCLHQNPKVRIEGLKTALQFDDKDAERLLLQDMESKDPVVRMHAVQLASFARGDAVTHKLVQIIQKGTFGTQSLALRKAAVHSLQDMARSEVLPELARFLESRSIFHSANLAELKAEVLRSLNRYPLEAAMPVLEGFIRSSTGSLHRLAQTTLAQVTRRASRG